MKTLFRSVLGYYQVAGGLIGGALCLVAIAQLKPTDALVLGIMVGAIVMYAFSVLCGVLLLRSTASSLPLKLSSANQLVQVLVIESNSVIYKFISGISITVGVNAVPELIVGLRVTLSTFLIQWDRANTDVFYGLNLVALVLLVLIFQEMKRNSEGVRTVSDQ